MAHFYGTLKGCRGLATRCGSKADGLRVVAASFKGAIEVVLRHEGVSDADRITVRMIPWQGVGCERTLFEGELGKDPAEV